VRNKVESMPPCVLCPSLEKLSDVISLGSLMWQVVPASELLRHPWILMERRLGHRPLAKKVVRA